MYSPVSELINNVMSEDLILVHCWLVVSQPISSMWWDLTMDIDVIFETWLVNYFLYFVFYRTCTLNHKIQDLPLTPKVHSL